jgi:phosphoribosylaminoimidazolecarboxamide formyltransferase/IMP cyclohydrolase
LRARGDNDENRLEYKQISGGFLVQEKICIAFRKKICKSSRKDSRLTNEIRALLLAWKVCKHVKSNAIVFADENAQSASARDK